MFGFATVETPELMPMAGCTAHRIAERLTEVRRSGELGFLRPDGKTQVTLGYEGFTPEDDRRGRPVDTAPPRPRAGLSSRSRCAAWSSTRSSRTRAWRCRPPIATSSTPQVPSSPADPRGMPGSPAARSSSTPTGAPPVTAAERSAARTRRRSTAPAPMPCAGSRRMPSLRASPIGSRCRSPTPSALHARSGSTSRRSAQGNVSDEVITSAIREVFDLRPQAIIEQLDLLAPDLPADGGVRSFRPRAARLHLGAHRPRRRAAPRRGAVVHGRGAHRCGCGARR